MPVPAAASASGSALPTTSPCKRASPSGAETVPTAWRASAAAPRRPSSTAEGVSASRGITSRRCKMALQRHPACGTGVVPARLRGAFSFAPGRQLGSQPARSRPPHPWVRNMMHHGTFVLTNAGTSVKINSADGDAGVAQLVEQLICNQQVGGSNPSTSSNRICFIWGISRVAKGDRL